MPKRDRYVALDTKRGRAKYTRAIVKEATEAARKINEQLAIDYANAVGDNLGQMLKREHVLLAGPTIDWRSMGIGGGEEVTVTVKLVGGQVSNAFLQAFIKGISR